MTYEVLAEQRATWQQKPVLRSIYEDYYQRIVAACVPGRTLEIGGGSGNLKDHLDQVVSTDLVPTPWLDTAADAQALPFADASLANVVGVDILHHIERPLRFLREASRILQPDGRLVLMEPAITPVSWVFYQFAHPEPVKMSEDPLVDGPLDPGRVPFDANQAIPTLLFGRHSQRMRQACPGLEIVTLRWLSFFAYPLSGGFRRWCLIPKRSVHTVLQIEDALAPIVGKLMGFRLFAVLRRQAFPNAAQPRG